MTEDQFEKIVSLLTSISKRLDAIQADTEGLSRIEGGISSMSSSITEIERTMVDN